MCLPEWEAITCDQEILQCVSGVKLDLVCDIRQKHQPRPLCFDTQEKAKMDKQVNILLSKNIVEPTLPSNSQFVSNIFCRPKKDGSVRIILNLSRLNLDIHYMHFKMETLNHVILLITPGCYFASIDLKDAYFTIPIHPDWRKFLRFVWNGQLLQFTCLPNGLAEAPRKFTKALKAPFSWLRARGFDNSSYLDDSCLLGDTEAECLENVYSTMQLLDNLGFTIHPDKSVIVPSHIIVYLGFVLDSMLMTVKLTQEKAQKIKAKCLVLLKKRHCTIRELAEFIGTVVAAGPGVDGAPLFYKRMEHAKDRALKRHKGDFEGCLDIDEQIEEDVLWWLNNVDSVHREIIIEDPSVVIQSDSSGFAWGGVCEGKSTGGPWTADEQEWHINRKELFAGFLTLKSFCEHSKGIHIRLEMDNMTSVTYINSLGGRKTDLNDLAREIWLWARERQIWISAVHLPGTLNGQADAASRKDYALEGEWMLNPCVFQQIQTHTGEFHVDLFATRINAQCQVYLAWKPDPGAKGLDSLKHRWNFNNMYAFPPFSLIAVVLQKILRETTTVWLIAPLWPGQHWFARLLKMVISVPRILPMQRNLLGLPQDPERIHPIWDRLKLTLFQISGCPYKVREFQSELPKSLDMHGRMGQRNSIAAISNSGCSFVVKGKLMRCQHL